MNGYALGARRIALHPGQHGVDDVLDQVVFAIGDKDLVADQGIGAVVVLDGRRGQGPDVRTGLGFGEQHGTAPLPRVEFLQVGLFLFLGAIVLNHAGRAAAHGGVGVEGPVGGHHVLPHGGRHRKGQPLPPVGRRGRRGGPFALAVALVDPVETRRNLYPAVLEGYPQLVAVLVGGQHFLESKGAGFGDDQIEHLTIEFVKRRQFAKGFSFEKLVQIEIDITPIGKFLGHMRKPPIG